tara:strand:+ start:3682 stop:4275 length:594 start_codon:yes stop_codon:yes gene_type:complete
VVRKRLGRTEWKDSESATSLSSPGKKQKVRSRNSTRSTEERLPGDSLDRNIQSTELSIKNSGLIFDLPPGKLKKQLEKALSQVQKTRSSLTKFETVPEAEEFEAEIKKYLPKDIGVFIIRKTEVNCYEITYKQDKELEEIRNRQIRKTFHANNKVDAKIEKEIKRAFQRNYWAKKNKADKLKKGTPKTTNKRSKRRS